MKRIVNNGNELLRADGESNEKSIEMIWANLSGKNIYGVLYYMYLESLAIQGLRSGTIELFEDDKLIESTEIRFNDGTQQTPRYQKHISCYE